MPKNPLADPITDQEIAFAHLILSGIMTDRRAAEAVGLNPATAFDTRAKPRVQTYMHEQRVAMHQEVVQKEAEQLSRKNLVRDQVLVRLWEIANLSHELTRNSVTAQIKALSLIISIEGLIPDRRAASAEKKPASPPPNIYRAPWLIERQQQAAGTWGSLDPVQDEDQPAPKDATSDPVSTSNRTWTSANQK
jgi:hypothetical protein